MSLLLTNPPYGSRVYNRAWINCVCGEDLLSSTLLKPLSILSRASLRLEERPSVSLSLSLSIGVISPVTAQPLPRGGILLL